MPYTRRTCPRKLASWIALFIIASLLLSGSALPGAQAAPQALLTSPDQPTFVSPANGAAGAIASPALSDSVTAPANNPAAANAAPDFTLVVIPDPQNLATSYPAVYNSQTQWAVDHKTSSNVVFVTAVGDLVNTSSSSTEYGRADAAFDILDAGNVPYSVGPGNHDIAFGTTLWENYFSASRFSGKSWYGGAYAANGYNTYSLFSASGMDFILINLQYNPTTDQIAWANNLLQTYSSRRGIVEQHDILNTNNSFVNQTSYNTLRSNANLFLMLCGHMHSGSDGAAYVAGTGTDGHTIHVVMQDYQDFSAGYIRIYRFSPADDIIYMTTYSPSTGGSITADPDQKNLVYVMPDAPPPTCYTLTLSHSGNGSTPAASPLKSAACSTTGQYVAGEAITLSGAVASAGWQISGWTGTSNNSSTANTNSLVMPASAQSAGVTYTQIEYALNLTSAHGSVAKSPNKTTYHYGDAVQLTAAADPGWVFTGWSGDLSGSANPATITMNGDRTVTATFVPMAEPKPPVVTVIALSGSNDVDLTWDAVTQDVNNNPTTITKYQVYGNHDPFFEPSVSDLLGEPTPPTATMFTHTSGSTDTTNWYYLVRAVNVIGESANSARRTGRFGFSLVPGTTP